MLTIHSTGTHVLDDGDALPLIIDTVWSAFTDPTEDEWRMYLGARRRQGFTAVLVSLLPILHDRVTRGGGRGPFATDDEHQPRYDGDGCWPLVEEYLAHARHFAQIARNDFGLVVMPCVLWNNYLPGTWGARLTPNAVMPPAFRRDLVDRVAEVFADLDVIFVVGGDDHYDVDDAVDGYLEAIEVLRAKAPRCLLTTHTAPRATLPEAVGERLDLFLHQSGHNVENQHLAVTQSIEYAARLPRRPVINSEPPYELHGHVGGHGRWTRDDVRRASWTSVLCGASAGVGYGSHGTWMWATSNGRFEAERASLAPSAWVDCLGLPGALDVSLLAALMRRHRLFRLGPAQHLIADDHGGAVRGAASVDGSLFALYLPYSLPVEITMDLEGYDMTAWDLHERVPIVPDPQPREVGTLLRQLSSQADQLVVGERR